jgi:hypothetical protein
MAVATIGIRLWAPCFAAYVAWTCFTTMTALRVWSAPSLCKTPERMTTVRRSVELRVEDQHRLRVQQLRAS